MGSWSSTCGRWAARSFSMFWYTSRLTTSGNRAWSCFQGWSWSSCPSSVALGAEITRTTFFQGRWSMARAGSAPALERAGSVLGDFGGREAPGLDDGFFPVGELVEGRPVADGDLFALR